MIGGSAKRQTPNAKRPSLILSVVPFLAILLVSALPSGVLAKTTSANIRAATSYAEAKGFCTAPQRNDAVCNRTDHQCGEKWAEFVDDHFDFPGGSAVLKDSGDSVRQEVVDFINADVQNRSAIPPLYVADCYCVCGGKNDTKSPCGGMEEGTPYRVKEGEQLTRDECEAACSPRSVAPKCAGTLPRIETADSQSAEGRAAAAKNEALQLNCFTREECTTQGGVWEAFGECRSGKGRCYAAAPEVQLNVPLGSVTKIRGLPEYIVSIYRYVLSILVVAVTIMFVYGAFRYLVGSSIGGVARGKEVMTDAVIGMLLVLSATAILRTLNPALTNLNPIKVYMVNRTQTINVMYCTDLPSGTKLADAGIGPEYRDRAEVEKLPDAYSFRPDTAVCGQSYYVEDATGNPCEGSKCKEGKACISCAGSALKECNGISGSKKVCAKLEIGGNIQYADGRYPEEVQLIFACANAKNPTDISIVRSNLDMPSRGKANVNRGARTGSDASEYGFAAYVIDMQEIDVANAQTQCTGSGNKIVGAFLGVKYNGGTAVVARSKCVGGGGKLSGYADSGDYPSAYQCGINSPNTDFENPSSAYWTIAELNRAVGGSDPITCNFNLDNTAAPETPAASYCAVKSAKSECRDGLVCSYGESCTGADGKKCTCTRAMPQTQTMGVMMMSTYTYECK